MSTKQDPGAYDCYAKLQEDEPYFVLRAKDATAPLLVRHWVQRRRIEAQVAGQAITPAYEAKLQEALKCADDMEAWRERHQATADVHETPRTT